MPDNTDIPQAYCKNILKSSVDLNDHTDNDFCVNCGILRINDNDHSARALRARVHVS